MESTKKIAFCTGVSGQDGSLLAEFLISKGYFVVGLLRDGSPKDNLLNILNHPNLKLVYGDLMNGELLRYLLESYKFDEIYNLASQSNVRLSYENPVLTFNVTLIGTISLVDSIKRYSPNSKVFQAGSSAMFGNSIDDDGYQRESTPFRPISPYASSKLFAHNICKNYRDNDGLYICNGILYNHESYKSKRLLGVVNTIVEKAILIKNEKLSSFHIPNLDIHIDCGHAKDYVEAMWICLQQELPDDYIISSNDSHDLRYICDYVFSKLEMNWLDYITTDDNKSEIYKIKGDSTKIRNLGWSPKYRFNQMLDEIIDYHLN